jgi:hypothetical protein
MRTKPPPTALPSGTARLFRRADFPDEKYQGGDSSNKITYDFPVIHQFDIQIALRQTP